MKDKNLCIGAICFMLALILFVTYKQIDDQEALADRISPELIRFHVLANSDSEADQQLKLEVKAKILDFMSDKLKEASSAADIRNYVTNNSSEIEQVAEEYMKSKGFQYKAEARLTDCYFPTKTYGDMVFPCGTYEALRIVIGEGEGKNWWCVLYPPMCFIDITYGVIPEPSRELLQGLLSEEDYDALTPQNRRDAEIEIKSKFLEWLCESYYFNKITQ